jgi:natural resistance-associated macrophage protein
MEGFLRIRWPRWRRVLVTRAIAIGPTLIVALMARGVENLTRMNDLLNCVQVSINRKKPKTKKSHKNK